MQHFTLRQLEYFVACVDHKSIARAAEALNVSQPTISVAIAKLEEQFGVQLLLRHHSHGVTPTANAVKLLQSSRGLLAHAHDLYREAKSTGTSVSGDVKLGSFSTLAPLVLPRLIRELGKDFPGINIKVTEGTQEHLLKALFEGALDLALLYDVELPDGLRCVRLSDRAPYVALPLEHPLARDETVSLFDLADQPMILLDISPSRAYFLGIFTALGLTPRVSYSSPSLELVRGMVGQGLGYSILVTRPQGDFTYDGKKLAIRPLKEDTIGSQMVLASLENLRSTQITKTIEQVALNLMPPTILEAK